MRVRLSDRASTTGLIQHFRTRGYLAVEEARHVKVVPINAVSERSDTGRFRRDLADWEAENPGVLAVVEAE